MARAAACSRRTRSSRRGANAAARSGIGIIAELPFVVGELELRRLSPTLPVASAPSQRCMSSLRTSWRLAAEVAAAAAAERGTQQQQQQERQRAPACDLVRIGKHVSGILKFPGSARRATAAGGGTLFRSLATAGFIGVALGSGRREGSGWRPCLRVERHRWLSPAAAKPHLPEIQ